MKKIKAIGGIIFMPRILNVAQRVTGKVKEVLKLGEAVTTKLNQKNLKEKEYENDRWKWRQKY